MRGACCMFAGHPGGKLLCLGVAAALVLAEAFCLDEVVSSVLTAGGKQDIAIQCHLAYSSLQLVGIYIGKPVCYV